MTGERILPYRSYRREWDERGPGIWAGAGVVGSCVIGVGTAVASHLAVARFQREAGQWALYGTARWSYYTLWGQDRPLDVLVVWTALVVSITLLSVAIRGQRFRRWWWVIAIHLGAAFMAACAIDEATGPLNP